ncbi:MAG: hypothetical protein Q9187_008717 [Circinaria calcarea]
MTNLTHPYASGPKYPTSNFVFNFKCQSPQTVPSKMPSEFAGAHFDFVRQSWKGGNVVENDGTIDFPSKDFIDLAPEGLSQDEAIDMATNLGLASGRLWIRTSETSSELDFIQSGFYLSKRFFLSTLHFTPDDNLINALKRHDSKRAVVTSTREAVHSARGVPD